MDHAVRIVNALIRVYGTATSRPVALYGAAVLRIGYGLAFLAFLLRESPNRDVLWGPDAAWSPAMDHQFAAGQPWYGWVRAWYTVLATGSETRFEVEYALALLVCALVVVGLCTRLTSCAFALVVTAFTGRDVFLTDGSDNVMVLMSLFLAFTACGRRFSLDSRLAARHTRDTDHDTARAPVRTTFRAISGALAELGEVRRRAVTLMHNAAVVVVGCQMCAIYGAAALWKVQGATWRDGTAMYYVLHTRWFQVWPGLSDYVASHALVMAVMAYVTVFAQLGFPFVALSRRPKYAVLALLLGMHLGIGILLGLPVFSAVMIIGDAVFLPDRFWQALARVAAEAVSSFRSRSRLWRLRAPRSPLPERAAPSAAGPPTRP